MAIDVISAFDLKRKDPLDIRNKVANETARLALTWYFKGLRTRQVDNNKWYEYIGDETTNLVADWRQIIEIHRGSGVPSNSLGFIDDVYIDETNRKYYLKTGTSTWTLQFNIDGSQILISATDPPSNGDGENGDLSIYSNGKVWKKIAGVWAFQFSIAGANGADGDLYATTSSTSINLSTATAPLAATLGTGLAYTVGQEVEFVSLSTPTVNFFTATIADYNIITGVSSLIDLVITGTATKADWQVNLAGAPGKQGKAFTHTEHDINLTQTKINSVQSGGYTPQNAWNASVLNDTRSVSELVATVGIEGSMQDHSISYDGTTWFDNGLWRGRKGDKGDKGDDGDDGIDGTDGIMDVEFLPSGSQVIANKLKRVYVHLNVSSLIQLGAGSADGTVVMLIKANPTAVIEKINGVGLFYRGSNNISTQYFFPSNIRSILAIYRATTNAWWIVAETNELSIGNLTQINNPSLSTFSLGNTSVDGLNGRLYPAVSFDFGIVTHLNLRPEITFIFGFSSDSSVDDTIHATIQRSINGGSSWTDLKVCDYKANGNGQNMYVTIQTIDINCPRQSVLYRLKCKTLTGGGSSRYTNDVDRIIKTIWCQ